MKNTLIADTGYFAVLFCRDDNRLWRETLRIHSRMELDYSCRIEEKDQC